jgi:hypothetical protein
MAAVMGSAASMKTSAGRRLPSGHKLTLEQVYAVLTPVEQQLGRRVSPTMYTVAEFRRRRAGGNPFLTKVLAGALVQLTDDPDGLLTAG